MTDAYAMDAPAIRPGPRWCARCWVPGGQELLLILPPGDLPDRDELLELLADVGVDGERIHPGQLRAVELLELVAVPGEVQPGLPEASAEPWACSRCSGRDFSRSGSTWACRRCGAPPVEVTP